MKKRTKFILIGVGVLIFGFLLVFCVNKGLREKVVILFKPGETETLADNNSVEKNTMETTGEAIRFLAAQKLEDVAEEEYYELEGAFSVYDNIVTVQEEAGKAYYKLNGGMLEKQEFSGNQVKDTIKLHETEYPLEFYYGMLDGKMYWEDTLDYSGNSTSASVEAFYEGDLVWLSVGMQQTAPYYVLYNVKTGQVIDIIKELLDEISDITLFERSPDGKKGVISTEDNVYLMDFEKKQGSSLKESIDLEGALMCEFINDTSLYVVQTTEEARKAMVSGKPYHISTYCYDLETGELQALHETTRDSIALGKGFFIEEKEQQYVLITPSGEEFFIDGMQPGSGIDFLLSTDQKKIVVTDSSGNGENGLAINELGVIDIEKREMKVFQREAANETIETEIFWNDNNSIAILAEGEKGYLYIYRLF